RTSSCVAPMITVASVSPSESVAPVAPTVWNVWFGGQRSGPAVSDVQTGLWLTAIVASAELLPGFESGLWPVTLAEFVRDDAAPFATCTTIDLLADECAATVPKSHVTTLAAVEQPGSPETKLSPAGSVSVAE